MTYESNPKLFISIGENYHEYYDYPIELRLFTGLTDKNGTEIYHKDKFKALSGDIYEVSFYRGAFGYFPEPEMNFRKFVSFAENFANLKGKGTQLTGVEVVTN